MDKLVESMIKALLELIQKLLSIFFMWLQAEMHIDELSPDANFFSEKLLGGHLEQIISTFTVIGIVLSVALFTLHIYFLHSGGLFTEKKDTFILLFVRLVIIVALAYFSQPFLDTVLDKGKQIINLASDDFNGNGEYDGYLNDEKTTSLIENATNMNYSSFMSDELIEKMIEESGSDITVEEYRKVYDTTSTVVDGVGASSFGSPLHMLVKLIASKVGEKVIETTTGVSSDIMVDSTIWLIFNGIVNIALYGVLAYYYFKLLFEYVRRYVTMMILKMGANIGNSLFSSAGTQMAFFSYYKMFGAEVFVFAFTKIWIDLSLYMMEHSDASLLVCLCCIAFIQAGVKLEQLFKELGLTISSTGASFFDSLALPAMIMMRAGSNAKNTVAKTMTGMGSMTGNTGLVMAGNALSGKPVSPADIQKTMESNPFGRARMASMARSGNNSATPSLNKNAAKLLREGGMFRNNGFNNALNSQTASGKKDMLGYAGESMFSNFKNDMASKGIMVDFDGYDMNKGLAFSEYDKNGDLLGTGFITDSIPKDVNGSEFKITGDDGNTYYGGFTSAESVDTPIDNKSPASESWIGDGQVGADGIMRGQMFDVDSASPSTSFEANSGVVMSADRLHRDATGMVDMDSSHYMAERDNVNGWTTLGYSQTGDPQGSFNPYAVVTEKGNTYRAMGNNASEQDIYQDLKNSNLAKMGYEIQQGSVVYTPGTGYAKFDAIDVANGTKYRMSVKNVVSYPQDVDRNIADLGKSLGHCVVERNRFRGEDKKKEKKNK